jgi:hypothetical protein
MNRFRTLFTIQPDQKVKLQRATWWTLGIIFVLQVYFVRELLAAELLFLVGFAILFSIFALVYAVGRAGERGLSMAEPWGRVVAQSTKRGWSALEEISRKPFRHPRSESAQ